MRGLVFLSAVLPGALCTNLACVYLLPQPEIRTTEYSTPNAHDAFTSISHWLGVDRLDTKPDNVLVQQASNSWTVERVFGAERSGKTLALALDGAHNVADTVNDLVPESLSAAFYPQPEAFTSANILTSLVTRARTLLGTSSVSTTSSSPVPSPDRILDLLSVSDDSPAIQTFVQEFGALEQFIDSDSEGFGAFTINLAALRQIRIESPEAYETAVAAVRAALQSVVAQNIRTALLVVPSSTAAVWKRADADQPPQQPLPPSLPPSHPIFSTDTCWKTADECTNTTSGCGGKGQCLSVKRGSHECFACACKSTVDSQGRTTKWSGEQCERKDVSASFTLILGATVLIGVLLAGSIGLLASVGGGPLPSVLGSVAVPGMKE